MIDIIYFDAFNGVSGDMILGSFVDSFVSFSYLQKEISKLGISDVQIECKKVTKSSLRSTKICIDFEHQHHHRNFSDIKKLIEKSTLDEKIKEDSIHIFKKLAEAEAKIHDKSIEDIKFHEVGAVDAIIDIVGAVISFHHLFPAKVLCSPINVGSGMVEAAHGKLPVPAPATLYLLKGVPIYSDNVQSELTTPTGAAIITHFAEDFVLLPKMEVIDVGYGAGEKDFNNVPNILRLILGRD